MWRFRREWVEEWLQSNTVEKKAHPA